MMLKTLGSKRAIVFLSVSVFGQGTGQVACVAMTYIYILNNRTFPLGSKF